VRKDCPFCRRHDILVENDFASAIYDAHPVTRGHTLVIPKRHFADAFESTKEEMEALIEIVRRVKQLLDDEYSPDGYNIGFNCGRAAGQSIMHLHIHVIPRYAGDRYDPTGGVRGVIPEKQRYEPS